MSDTEFEDVVISICRRLLGVACTKFAEGKDGGRDAFFEGKADNFPNQSHPISGKIVIQAKHTTNPIASCSDNDFINNKKSTVREELPRIRKLENEKDIDYYLFFTNRKQSGGADKRFRDLIDEQTGVKQCWLFGREQVLDYLKIYPDIILERGLGRFTSPLSFTPDALRTVLGAINRLREDNPEKNGRKAFKDYPGITKKNQINKVSEEYYEFIQENSSIYFDAIDSFLSNPRNEVITQQYHDVAEDWREGLILNKNKFLDFNSALGHLTDAARDRLPELIEDVQSRRMVRVIVHYMYCHCEIGRKSYDDSSSK